MRRWLSCVVLAVLCVLPSAAAAQSAPPAEHERLHLYLGMWTLHLRDQNKRLDPNYLIAASYRHVFGAAFINSFDKFAFGGGVQKEFARGHKGVFSAALGGRLGAIYGYDERFLALAKKTPILPMVQAYGLFEIGHVGVEVSYTYVVISLTGSIRF